MQSLIKELGLEPVHIDGCALGLRTNDEHETPIKKPWTLYTNSPSVLNVFSACKCPGSREHPRHEPCAGKHTKGTESYTDEMVRLVHKAHMTDCKEDYEVTYEALVDDVRYGRFSQRAKPVSYTHLTLPTILRV